MRPPSRQPAILTEKLTKDYGDDHGVFDLDLEVHSGEILGFLGPNGAGKSTTMRMLVGLIEPTSGRAQILGRDVVRDEVALHRRIGYLAGDFGLYPQLTGAAVLRHFSRLHGNVDPARVRALVERFDAQLDRPVRDLSTGNRQKLGLIQAFMHDPELLVLDEPISGLDPLVQHRFHELLAEVRDSGRTVLLSSHALSEVDRVADRVAIIRAGRLVVVEALEDLRAVAVRRWEIEFEDPPSADRIRALPGVREADLDGNRMRVAFQGSPDAIVKLAAQHGVSELHTREGDLEDVFLRYYEEERP